MGKLWMLLRWISVSGKAKLFFTMHEVTIDIGAGPRTYDLSDDEVGELALMLVKAQRRAPARAGRKGPKPSPYGGAAGMNYPFGFDDED